MIRPNLSSLTHRVQNERGIALVVVLLVALAVTAISAAAALISTNASLINRYNDRASLLESAADPALEEGRSAVNGNRTLYPAEGYTTLESGVVPKDASGADIPGLRRWTYVGPTGVTSGQYGVFGSVVTVVEDAQGNRVVRRGEIVQESFAKYAYFTDIEPATISFGGGDQIYGPVHTNDYLKVLSSGATFHGPVVTHLTVQGGQYATFRQGVTQNGPYISMPQTADLTKLRTQAIMGNTSFVGNTVGTDGQATTRIEFVSIDLNADGDGRDANEGFIKVYQALVNATCQPAEATCAPWVSGNVPADYAANGLRNSNNCGHIDAGQFVVARVHPLPNAADNWDAALISATRRCYLGGSDALNTPDGFLPNDGRGSWLLWPGVVSPLVAGRPDGAYLFPITRQLNPSFKGVIYVEGKVIISGVLRGQVTVAATGGVVIADDITYATDPGTGTCADILGVFSATDITVSDNTLNNPTRRRAPGAANNAYLTYDETSSEFIHGVVLALSNFQVEGYNLGSTNAEPCGATTWGRGCLYLSGGIIQSQRGAVGTSAGTGYLKRYAYDQCAFSSPPPYFPTTGRFARGRYFEVDPTGFDVATLFQMLTPGS